MYGTGKIETSKLNSKPKKFSVIPLPLSMGGGLDMVWAGNLGQRKMGFGDSRLDKILKIVLKSFVKFVSG